MPDWWSPLTSTLPKTTANKLKRARGLDTVGDLLSFVPRRFLNATGDLAALNPGDYVVFIGTVTTAATRHPRPVPGRKPRTMLSATVRSGEHTLALTFFNAYPHVHVLTPGVSGLFAGVVSRYRDTWQLAHPVYELVDEHERTDPALSRPQVPVYRQVAGLPSWSVSRAVELVLDTATLTDPVPAHLLARRGLPAFDTALRWAHLPTDDEQHRQARTRMKYDEALLIQLALAQRRHQQRIQPARPRPARCGGLLAAFDAAVPFTLTAGQQQVGEQILADLAREHPMNRLLQGDVGSGKTVVALRAMLAVIDAGGQAALLAPTEVLAQQHYRSLHAMLGPLAEGGMLTGSDNATGLALVLGADPAAKRQAAMLAAASGQAGIVIGTHALLSDNVTFADLGLIVVDEQHRFGVEQRDGLRGKAKQTPHMLVMTATPIPRTVAMTVFGDMDTSVLAELPAGRAAIQTNIVDNSRWYERVWQRVAEEVKAGRQAYVVAPRIGDGQDSADGSEQAHEWVFARDEQAEASGQRDQPDQPVGAGESGQPTVPMRGVYDIHAELAANPALAGLRLGLLHGRLPSEIKDETMLAFGRGEIDVLVSTTVIEVGVDVPNASVMVIVDADRFGVSQLHQLRGRVGRGAHPGLCLLVTRDPGEAARERLTAVASTTNGFELARLDLHSRREGDVLGARQSGRGSTILRLTSAEDEQIIDDARHDATELIDADPTLSGHRELARRLDDRLDESHIDYLQKG